MQNTRIKTIVFLILILVGLSFLFPQLAYAHVHAQVQGSYFWLYDMDSGIAEADFLSHMEYMEANNIDFIIVIDISKTYKKRVIYLLGELQKERDFLVASSNTPKSESVFLKNEFYKYFVVNLIYTQDEDSAWFLSDTGTKYNRIMMEDDISEIIDTIHKEENFVNIIRSQLWDAHKISSVKNYIQAEDLWESGVETIGKVSLVTSNQASTLRWFNTLGKFLMGFYGVVIVVFIVFVTVFRVWSKRRILKKGDG